MGPGETAAFLCHDWHQQQHPERVSMALVLPCKKLAAVQIGPFHSNQNQLLRTCTYAGARMAGRRPAGGCTALRLHRTCERVHFIRSTRRAKASLIGTQQPGHVLATHMRIRGHAWGPRGPPRCIHLYISVYACMRACVTD